MQTEGDNITQTEDDVVCLLICHEYEPKLVLKIARMKHTICQNEDMNDLFSFDFEYWCYVKCIVPHQHSRELEKRLNEKCLEVGGRPYNDNSTPIEGCYEFKNRYEFLNALYGSNKIFEPFLVKYMKRVYV
jgi:hypothetical protein